MHRSSPIASSDAYLQLTEESYQAKLSRLRDEKRFWLNASIALLTNGFLLLLMLLFYELLINRLDGGVGLRMAWFIVSIVLICAGRFTSSVYSDCCSDYEQAEQARKP